MSPLLHRAAGELGFQCEVCQSFSHNRFFKRRTENLTWAPRKPNEPSPCAGPPGLTHYMRREAQPKAFRTAAPAAPRAPRGQGRRRPSTPARGRLRPGRRGARLPGAPGHPVSADATTLGDSRRRAGKRATCVEAAAAALPRAGAALSGEPGARGSAAGSGRGSAHAPPAPTPVTSAALRTRPRRPP